MKSKSVIYLELKNFFRAKMALSGVLILLFVGVAAMYFGIDFIQKQKNLISSSVSIQQKQRLNDIQKFGYDLGDFLYQHAFITAHLPSAWASFATGQRDVHAFVLPVRMLALEGQMYDTDLVNPITQLLGNLDVSFVYLLVFPLIIIAFSYNVWSQEQESGVWRLVNVQSQSGVLGLLMRKLWIRFVLVYFIAILLLLLSAIYMKLPFDATFFAVWITLSTYLLFWFAVISLVISFNRGSSFNAVTLLAVWIVLSVFLPAILNVWLSQTLPVPEALSTVVQQRESYHEKWDKPKETTMLKFYEHYPEIKKYPLALDKFTWGWYYAMQQMGDDESEQQSKDLLEKLQRRQNWTNTVAFFVPTINAQLQLNDLANTDLQSHIEYLNALKKYHEQIRLYFYPLVFTEAKIERVNFGDIPPMRYTNDTAIGIYVWLRMFTSLLISILLFVGAYVNLKKRISFFL